MIPDVIDAVDAPSLVVDALGRGVVFEAEAIDELIGGSTKCKWRGEAEEEKAAAEEEEEEEVTVAEN